MPPDVPNTPDAPPRRIFLPAATILVAILTLHFAPTHGIDSYAAAFLVSSAIYLWLAYEVTRAEIRPGAILLLVGASLLVRASFLLSMPIGSDDVFRYLWDGKVQAAGINPYLHAPNAPELASLRSSLLPAAVNHPDMKTVYFPISQWIFFMAFKLAGEGVWGIKLCLLLAEILTLSALWRFSSLLQFPRTNILLYALCPLPIIQFACDAHLDGLGLPLLAYALVLHLGGKRTASLLLLGASLAIKPVALVLVPILLMGERTIRGRLLVLGLPCVPFVLQFVPYLASANPLEGLFVFSRHWTFNGVAFEAINAILSNNLPSRIICAGCLVVSLLLVYRSSIDQIRKMYLAVLLLLIFSPVVHPWYICWLLLFLPPVRPVSGILYASTASLTVFTVVAFRNTGMWAQQASAVLAEYLPVLAALVKDVVGWTRRGQPGGDGTLPPPGSNGPSHG